MKENKSFVDEPKISEKMLPKFLERYIGLECEVFRTDNFHFKGKVLSISPLFLILLDYKTGKDILISLGTVKSIEICGRRVIKT